MKLNKEKLRGLNFEFIPAGNDGPHNGESDVCLVNNRIVAYSRFGAVDGTDNWDWVHKNYKK